MGDYLKTATNTYIVSEDDVMKFEVLLNEKAASTKKQRIRYLKKALSELGYQLSPDGIRELLNKAETPNIARHTTNSLKLFIKTVLREKNPELAHLLYSSFKVPRGKYKHKPESLSLEVLRKIFENIEHLGAKTYFLLLCETGLRIEEVYGITLEQIDLEHRIIRLMKESETKRAYISFIHPKTTEFLKNVYLPYREEFVK